MISSSATTTPQRGPSLPTSLTPPSCACSRSISCRCGSCRVARVSARRRRHALGYPQMPPHQASREWPYQCAPLPPHFPGGGHLHATAAAACARRRSPCSRQACSRALYPSTSARGAPAATARARRRWDALHAFSHTRSSHAWTLPWYVILVHAWLSPALTRAPHHTHTHPPGPLAAGMLESAMSKHVGTRRSHRRCPRPSREPALTAGVLESTMSKHVGTRRSRRRCPRPSQEPALTAGVLESTMSKHVGTRRSRRRCPCPSQAGCIARVLAH